MKPIDPDLAHVLHTIAANEEARRVVQARKKYDERAERQLETAMELLADEVEGLVPRSNPMFESVLLLTAIRKIAHGFEEPDASALEFPHGW